MLVHLCSQITKRLLKIPFPHKKEENSGLTSVCVATQRCNGKVNFAVHTFRLPRGRDVLLLCSRCAILPKLVIKKMKECKEWMRIYFDLFFPSMKVGFLLISLPVDLHSLPHEIMEWYVDLGFSLGVSFSRVSCMLGVKQ